MVPWNFDHTHDFKLPEFLKKNLRMSEKSVTTSYNKLFGFQQKLSWNIFSDRIRRRRRSDISLRQAYRRQYDEGRWDSVGAADKYKDEIHVFFKRS